MMGSLKPGANIIYESPDNGDTVYARYAGETERWMVGQSTKAKDRIDLIKEDKLWGEIRRAARSNQILQDALDRVKILYELSKEDGKK
jgi:hypothetical protein